MDKEEIYLNFGTLLSSGIAVRALALNLFSCKYNELMQQQQQKNECVLIGFLPPYPAPHPSPYPFAFLGHATHIVILEPGTEQPRGTRCWACAVIAQVITLSNVVYSFHATSDSESRNVHTSATVFFRHPTPSQILGGTIVLLGHTPR